MSDPNRHYVGLTSDIYGRLKRHNDGLNTHTADQPWQVLIFMHFHDALAAARFERYLKSGSGRAFARRHFG